MGIEEECFAIADRTKALSADVVVVGMEVVEHFLGRTEGCFYLRIVEGLGNSTENVGVDGNAVVEADH